MGICTSLTQNLLKPELITKNLEEFMKGMVVRSIGIDDLKDKLVKQVFSGNATDVESWKSFFKDNVENTKFGQTSKEIVDVAMEDAKTNYNDQTLPLLSLLFLADSDKDRFKNVFKAVNLASHTKDTAQTGADFVNAINNKNVIGGIFSGIKAAIDTKQVITQATNPDVIDKKDLLNLTKYYTNLVTLLPAQLLAKTQEGSTLANYVNKVLDKSFSKETQTKFVNSTIFNKYNDKTEIDINSFFDDNYDHLKDDSKIRNEFVTSYIENLGPEVIANLIKGDKEEKAAKGTA